MILPGTFHPLLFYVFLFFVFQFTFFIIDNAEHFVALNGLIFINADFR